MASFDDPLRRRRPGDAPLDPFSDAARFPTLVHDQNNDAQAVSDQIRAAAIGGPNSVAGRFNPLDAGSIFARNNPGIIDAARDAERQVLAPRSSAVSTNGPQELSSIDRYAITTGYQTPQQIAQQQGLGAIDRSAYDTQPAQRANIAAAGSISDALRRRRDPYNLFSE